MGFLKGDRREMDRVAPLGEERAEASSWMRDIESGALAYFGHMERARRASQRAIALALQAGRVDFAAQHEAGAAVREALFGYPYEARQLARVASGRSKDRDAVYGAALALTLVS